MLYQKKRRLFVVGTEEDGLRKAKIMMVRAKQKRNWCSESEEEWLLYGKNKTICVKQGRRRMVEIEDRIVWVKEKMDAQSQKKR